ncbi:MAG: OmpA family protein [Clostridia bacterium]|nr:OmpA family protein [Clostridia bacterium]
MRSYRKTARTRRGRSDGSFWLSFSDLMSSLVLIIILVMFYIIYQYFNLAEINQAEIARREYQLDAAQVELESQRTKLSEAEKQMIAQQILLDAKQKDLDDAQAVLEAQKTEIADAQSQLEALGLQLTEQEAQLAAQQILLNAKQEELDGAQAVLEDQQSQLATQQSQLSEQEAQLLIQQSQLYTQQSQLETQRSQLADQQSQLSEQQAQLENQQMQIEQLVGLKPRIIAALSNALKQSNISATVDTVTGSIALESDVLFESGKYELTSAGRSFVDRFLPVYLEVLFSEGYREYVSEIIIEGHTDSDGGYLSNLELSQQRALAVASYVLGSSCKTVSADVKNELRPVVTVNGRSFSDRIFDERGVEDKDASRRVVFKFRLTDEQMIQQMRQILEAE